MTWVKLDDQFPDHPKVDALSDGAVRLYVAGLCHASRYLTDGFVPAERVQRMVPRFKRSQVAELVTVGLWHDSPGGWMVHDYLLYNPSAEQVKAAREAERERKARQRAKGARKGKRGKDGKFTSQQESRRDTPPDDPGDGTVGVHRYPSPPDRGGDGECLSTGDGPSAPAATGDADSPVLPTPVPGHLREVLPGKRKRPA